MNKYIIPICDIKESSVYNIVISATGIHDCEDKIMKTFSDYSTALEYNDFLNELDKQDILIGDIEDIESL